MSALPDTASQRSRDQIITRVLAAGAVAVLRLRENGSAMRVIEALLAGGISGVEVTATTPGAIGVIDEAARRFGDDILLGVGSVLDVRTASEAVSAGARYVVSPVFHGAVLAEAHRLGVPAMPGAYTPSEIFAAHEAGADIVKVFPAEGLGPAFIRGVLAPMPFLRLMPTGGVTPDNVGDWIAAGAAAVGLGSALVDQSLIASGDFAALEARARRLRDNLLAARASGRGSTA